MFENMMEVRKDIAEQALSRTKLLRWLLSRVKARDFDSNKFYASELLSILMQGSEPNQKRLGAMNGVDSLLQVRPSQSQQYGNMPPLSLNTMLQTIQQPFSALGSVSNLEHCVHLNLAGKQLGGTPGGNSDGRTALGG